MSTTIAQDSGDAFPGIDVTDGVTGGDPSPEVHEVAPESLSRENRSQIA